MHTRRLPRSAWYALRRRRALHPALVANGGPYDVVTVTPTHPDSEGDHLIDLLPAGSTTPITVRFPRSRTTTDALEVWVEGGNPKPLFRVIYNEGKHPHWALTPASTAETQGPLPALRDYLNGRQPT